MLFTLFFLKNCDFFGSLTSNLTNYPQYPDYGNVTIVCENTTLNYTALSDGYINIITHVSTLTIANIFINGTDSGLRVLNALFFPVKAGDVITTDINVRLASFIPYA